MDDISTLIAQITAAFEGVSREGGVSLREGRVLDNCGSEKKLAQARALDTDARWQDVSDDDLKYYASSMYFLDAIGLCYYLPAFMSYVLRHFRPDIDYDEDFVLQHTLWHLEDNQHHKRYAEMQQSMTRPQKEAIGSFLQWVATQGDEFYREDAARALRDNWSHYDDNPQDAANPAAPQQEPTHDTHP